jgi:plastocyanin
MATLVVSLLVGVMSTAWGATQDVELRIKNQEFQPDVLTIPAGQAVTIRVENEDTLPAEFESNDFNREKVIPGGTKIPVYVGPLTAGTYKFFNDFHPQSTGKLVAVAPAVSPAADK